MNKLEQLRAGKLGGVTRLNLSCGLKTFPREILELGDTLEALDLSGNDLSSLPDDLPRLHKLKILFCSNNPFTELPEVLGQCAQLSMVGFRANQLHTVSAASLPPSLRWLILTGNQLETLPAELGQCGQLQKLMVAGNRLQSLPAEMAACHRLELLRIAANRFECLPDWLTALPRLSWLSYSGNPVCESQEDEVLTHTPVPSIAWKYLQLLDKLGEGASGVIYRAIWREPGSPFDSPRDVAVKLFKGALTSDGLPLSEMAACMQAGEHPNLIDVLGKISGHPDGAVGLVMALVDASYVNLAGPPSLDSCTRDVYAADTTFSLATVARMAAGLSGVGQQLHARGILHGDLYGHNILLREDGDALLGDFGAASLVDPQDQRRAQALQRLEVRAFGCLLQELLERCVDASSNQTGRTLNDLAKSCLQENVARRPLFADIHQVLSRLA